MKKILFVCLGNICRSPLAEEVFRVYVAKQGGEKDYFIDSAGLISYHEGELPDRRMREQAYARGYVLTHRSRPVTPEDFEEFDYVVGMDRENDRKLHRLARSKEQEQKILRMIDFCGETELDGVPDPYYDGLEGFKRVIDMVEKACPALFRYIMSSLD